MKKSYSNILILLQCSSFIYLPCLDLICAIQTHCSFMHYINTFGEESITKAAFI